MQRCLQLAEKGLGRVAPNPMVGCVIVHNNQIIGEGYHQQFGESHAEVNAIRSVSDQNRLSECILYVNLEPCSHFGKTPPCADLIIEKKIPVVVIGSYDPNPKVAGQGIDRLTNAGVKVTTEVLKAESDFLNRRFITFHTQHRPYVILKWAQSADGFMAMNEPKQVWLSNQESKVLSHQWRTEESAILVGRNTVSVDNCELTARLWAGSNPVRVVIDKHCSLAITHKVFNAEACTIIFNEEKSGREEHLEFIRIDFEENVVKQILTHLYRLNILSVIIEGGAETLRHFIEVIVWDEARIISTPLLLHTGIPAPVLNGYRINQKYIDGDCLNVLINQ